MTTIKQACTSSNNASAVHVLLARQGYAALHDLLHFVVKNSLCLQVRHLLSGVSLHAQDRRVEWSLHIQLSKHLRAKFLKVVADFPPEAVESAQLGSLISTPCW
jgi:hypothetical protein